jgi:hypothetical protein
MKYPENFVSGVVGLLVSFTLGRLSNRLSQPSAELSPQQHTTSNYRFLGLAEPGTDELDYLDISMVAGRVNVGVYSRGVNRHISLSEYNELSNNPSLSKLYNFKKVTVHHGNRMTQAELLEAFALARQFGVELIYYAGFWMTLY